MAERTVPIEFNDANIRAARKFKAQRDALVKAASRVIEEWPRASISYQPIIDELVELRDVVARVGQVKDR